MTRRSVQAGILAALSEVAAAVEAVSHETTPRALLEASCRELTSLLGATACVVSRLDGAILHEVASCWPAEVDTRTTFPDHAYLLDDYPLTRAALESGKPRAISLSDDSVDPSEAFVLRELDMHAVLMLPLKIGGRAWGLIEVYDTRARLFDYGETALAELFARQAAGFLAQIENAEAVQRLYRETLASLANALEEKDAYTSHHAHEVVAIAVDVARRLDLGDDDLRAVELGALLHDIGKIRVPESILNKPGPLDDEEWQVMRRHTEVGASILAPIASLAEVLPIVRSSHERWDGRGYPDGLSGEEIPVGARIISVCDAFRAMVEPRAYRPALSPDHAVKELHENAGTQFDPACVDALLAVFEARERAEHELLLHRPAYAL